VVSFVLYGQASKFLRVKNNLSGVNLITYGKDKVTGYSVHIRNAANGIKCGCVCSSCDSALVAHQGDITDWHYKHHIAEECSYSAESGLHLRAKEILAESKYFRLPRLNINIEKFSPDLEETFVINHDLVKHNQKVVVDLVLQEKGVGNIRPDLKVYSGENILLIEIAVTHFVDKAKLRKIKSLDISCVEIDLSSFKNKEINDKSLRNKLLDNTAYSKWIYNHKKNKACSQLKAYLDKDIYNETKIRKNRLRSLLDSNFSGSITVTLEIIYTRDSECIFHEFAFTVNKKHQHGSASSIDGKLVYSDLGVDAVDVYITEFFIRRNNSIIFESNGASIFNDILIRHDAMKICLLKRIKESLT
jgi:hypothetical protein